MPKILHPLSIGKLTTVPTILYRVDTAQQIGLSKILLRNTDAANTYHPTIQLYSRGQLVDLTPNVALSLLKPGFSLDVLTGCAEKSLILDKGCIIFGFADVNDAITFIIDGKEASTNE